MKYCIPLLILMLVQQELFRSGTSYRSQQKYFPITGNDSLNISDDLRFGFGFSMGSSRIFKYFSLIIGAGFESEGEECT